MSRTYIAATLTLREDARRIARLLSPHTRIVSTWHDDQRATVAIEATLNDCERNAVAFRCLDEVRRADIVVLLVGPETTRHSSFVEVGYAIGKGKYVCTLLLEGAAEIPLVLRTMASNTESHLIDEVRDWAQSIDTDNDRVIALVRKRQGLPDVMANDSRMRDWRELADLFAEAFKEQDL